jgi:hypothetical protein
MNIEQLKEGQELQQLIETTQKGIKELESLKEKRKITIEKLNDGQFWLTIAELKDGSGSRAELNRSFGNAELLDMIINKLKEQLKDLNSKFMSL